MTAIETQPTTDRIPVVLDVDTGVDDACAILLAALHPRLDLRAVTCVGGNAPLADVVRNTLTVLDVAGRRDIPVAAGASRPLLERPQHARHVHGEDGMADLGLAPPSRSALAGHAIEVLRDVLLRAAAERDERVTLVALAPLTNIALLLRTFPHVAPAIDRIVFMGGAANTGNATAAAEFNVFHDPEAAAVVLDAATELEIPVTMYGLDVFYAPTVTTAEAAALRSADPEGPAGLGGALIAFQAARFGADSATIGDAGAVCAVIAPDGLVTRRLPVRVELAGTWTRGSTIVDTRHQSLDRSADPHGLAPGLLDVALGIDGQRYADLWRETLLAAATRESAR